MRLTRGHWSLTAALAASAGAVLLMIGVSIWQPTPAPRMDAQTWLGARLTPLIGTIEPDAKAGRVQLDSNGQALLAVPVTAPVTVAGPGFLVVAGDGLARLASAAVLWQRVYTQDPAFADAAPATVDPVRQMPLPPAGWAAIRLPLTQEPAWQGQIARLAILLEGQPLGVVRIDRIALNPLTPFERLRALGAGWASFTPWNQASINAYPARANAPPIARVPAVVAWLGSSLLTYMVWLRFRRGTWDWRVPSALFMVAWLLLDAPWQWHLARQFDETRHVFATFDDDRARRASPFDGDLYAFVAEAKTLIERPASRVFVGSADDYRGMRLNYHLYPLNAFWSRHGDELPAAHRMAGGDYIALAQPSRVIFDPQRQELRWSPQQSVSVKMLLFDERGGLFRIAERAPASSETAH